ncbi:DUF423 domain-containing protein [Flavobacterium rhizosphaerae]|uniref:DUF423 domain-containing protein n=1 Tax=Flavobacterium rhizosphaerae TaxID=3163298 RepID=A0ABW8YWW7_9FLAO
MNRKVIATAAFFGFTGIILGAFGAHGLKKIVTPELVATFETGVRYQVYHALFLLFIGSTALLADKTKKVILALVVAGVILFSASIYLLALNEQLNFFDFKKIGWVTPIGGLVLIIAWLILFINVLKKK